jgi:uncharacterized protein
MSANPFLVNIAALRPPSGGRHHVVRRGRLGGLAITCSAVPADAEVVVDADIEVVDGGVVVTGVVSSTWVGECRRCLHPVTGELVAQVREIFERVPRTREGAGAASGAGAGAGGGILSVDSDEADTYLLTGDTLDLAPMARDALLLELPLAPLCRTDCPGLCPTCGTDLTEETCDCHEVSANPVWAALDGLLFPAEDVDRVGRDN